MRTYLAVLVLSCSCSVACAQPSCSRCGPLGVYELYSSADGVVQFLMLTNVTRDAVRLDGQTLIASDGVTEKTFTFPAGSDLTASRSFLIATRGFADLQRIAADYLVPNGFFALRAGSLRLGGSGWWDRDDFRYAVLPDDGTHALYSDIDGDFFDLAQATNNKGQSIRFTPNAATSFRMTAIFSDQAGLNQYIQLEERSGLDNQHHFAGLTLEVTSRKGAFKSMTFPNDLPESTTAGRPVLIGTTHTGLPQVDFTIPPGFLPTDGGTLVFAGVEVWDYDQLPANGYTVALRDGTWTTNRSSIAGFVFRPFTGLPTGLLVYTNPVIEYYNKWLDQYFITSSQPDIDALDSGLIGPRWERTGESFPAWTTTQDAPLTLRSPPDIGPVCRLYIPEGDRSSHFFSASPDECAEAKAQHPDYIEETRVAFYASVPDQNGQCGFDQIAVYRLWNARVDSNHRYTTSAAIRDLMKSKGYIAEGYGPEAVAMCVGGGISSE